MTDLIEAALALGCLLLSLVAFRYSRIARQYHSRLQALNFQEAELERLAAQGGDNKI